MHTVQVFLEYIFREEVPSVDIYHDDYYTFVPIVDEPKKTLFSYEVSKPAPKCEGSDSVRALVLFPNLNLIIF